MLRVKIDFLTTLCCICRVFQCSFPVLVFGVETLPHVENKQLSDYEAFPWTELTVSCETDIKALYFLLKQIES